MKYKTIFLFFSKLKKFHSRFMFTYLLNLFIEENTSRYLFTVEVNNLFTFQSNLKSLPRLDFEIWSQFRTSIVSWASSPSSEAAETENRPSARCSPATAPCLRFSSVLACFVRQGIAQVHFITWLYCIHTYMSKSFLKSRLITKIIIILIKLFQ